MTFDIPLAQIFLFLSKAKKSDVNIKTLFFDGCKKHRYTLRLMASDECLGNYSPVTGGMTDMIQETKIRSNKNKLGA